MLRLRGTTRITFGAVPVRIALTIGLTIRAAFGNVGRQVCAD